MCIPQRPETTSDDESEEEKQAIDSDEEINGEDESQEVEQDQPSQRLRKKTTGLDVLMELPPPDFDDYPQSAWPKTWRGSPAPKPGDNSFTSTPASASKAFCSSGRNTSCARATSCTSRRQKHALIHSAHASACWSMPGWVRGRRRYSSPFWTSTSRTRAKNFQSSRPRPWH